MNPRCSQQSGFTLLELMVALVILALGIVGLMRAVSQGMTATAQIRDVTTATTLGQMKMEELASNVVDLPAESNGDFGDEAPEFSWQAVAEETDIEGLIKITVVVLYQRGNRQQSVTLETCVSENMQVTPLEEMEDGGTVTSNQ